MSEHRDLSLKKFGLSFHVFREMENFALQYSDMRRRLSDARNTYTSPQITGMPHGSATSDSTARAAVVSAQMSEDVELIESAADEACGDACESDRRLFLKAVTNSRVSYENLQLIGEMQMCRNLYYERRRMFYYLLAQKKNRI